jgi:hypothetical protein
MKLTRPQLRGLFIVFAAVWLGTLMLQGFRPSVDFVRPVSVALAIALLAASAFDRVLWRLPFLHPWAVSEPVLRGTWRGVLESDWEDPATGDRRAGKMVYLVVRQTLSSLSLRLLTDESTSHSLSASVVTDRDGVRRVVAVYRNEPPVAAQSASPIHRGGLELHVRGARPTRLDGEYWTDRKSRGHLSFDVRSSRVHDDYRSALVDNALGG